MSYNMTKEYDEANTCWNYYPKGDVDIHSSNEFKKEILRDLETKKADILIDAKDLVYMDSTGLGALITVYKEVDKNGNKIYIDNIRKFVLKLFKITEIDKLFTIRSESNE